MNSDGTVLKVLLAGTSDVQMERFPDPRGAPFMQIGTAPGVTGHLMQSFYIDRY